MNRHCALVLHAHVPWVRHPETDRCLEEDWIFESIVESYLPLLEVLHRLRDEGVPWKLTLNLSPTLLGMLDDPLMRDRASAYLDRTLKLAASEAEASTDGGYRRLAQWYQERLTHLQAEYETRWNRDLVAAFKSLSDSGHLEITACGATHGLLPLLVKVPEAARAQIRGGIQAYEKAFGKEPKGFWLPECAYSPAMAPMLADAGLSWTLLEEHGLASSSQAPDSAPFHPAIAGSEDGLAVFGRDAESSRQVWNADQGYPGDARYREFYRDVGLDAPAEALDDYLDGSGIRRFTGLKFYRITGDTDDKQFYDPALAKRAVAEHAIHFLESRAAQLATLESRDIAHPLVVSAFDAELFGHWWFEGPLFLEEVFRRAANRDDFEFTTPTAYLEETGDEARDRFEPIASSWGEGGYFETWLSEENAWIYPHLHTRAEQLLRAIAILKENLSDLPEDFADHRQRTVAQMTRELMLAQASDWAFLMRNGAAKPYATKQTQDRLDRFDELWGVFSSNPETAGERLAQIEKETPFLPDLSWDVFGELVEAAIFIPGEEEGEPETSEEEGTEEPSESAESEEASEPSDDEPETEPDHTETSEDTTPEEVESDEETSEPEADSEDPAETPVAEPDPEEEPNSELEPEPESDDDQQPETDTEPEVESEAEPESEVPLEDNSFDLDSLASELEVPDPDEQKSE